MSGLDDFYGKFGDSSVYMKDLKKKTIQENNTALWQVIYSQNRVIWSVKDLRLHTGSEWVQKYMR